MSSGQPHWRNRAVFENRDNWKTIGSHLATIRRNSAVSRRLQSLARSIAVKIESLDCVLEQLCRQSCRHCIDVCCLRATIWYDFRDLLFYRLHTGGLPLQKIVKDGAGACIHLSTEGCRLPRCQRPFVCTWYICPTQKEAMRRLPDICAGPDLVAVIRQIQDERKMLGECYMSTDPAP